MYKYLEVIKFNDTYFEDGDVIAITKEDGNVIVGSIIIGNKYSGSTTNANTIALDISEKYHEKRTFVYMKEIKNIQKVNQ